MLFIVFIHYSQNSFCQIDYKGSTNDSILNSESISYDTIYAIKGDIFIYNGVSTKIKNDTLIFLKTGEPYQHILKSISRNEIIYNSLFYKAQKNIILKEAHHLIFRPLSPESLDTSEFVRSEGEYVEYANKIIRNIYIKRIDVFGPTVYDTLEIAINKIVLAVNKAHIYTRLWVLRKYILPVQGDLINPNALADNERMIRKLSFIRDAKIYIEKIKNAPDSVDLIYVIQDAYPLGIGLNISDWNAGNVDVWHNNLFGLGVENFNSIIWDYNKISNLGYEGGLRLNNIAGTFFNTYLHYYNALYQNSFSAQIARPMYSPDASYAGSIIYEKMKDIKSITALDTIYKDQSIEYDFFDFWAAKPIHLTSRRNLMANNRYNLVLSARYQSYKFSKRPPIQRELMYTYHNRFIYLGSVTLLGVRYIKSNLIYSYDITEDIPSGFSLKATFGYEINEFQTRTYGSLVFDFGSYFKANGYIYNSIGIGSFYDRENNSFEQGVLKLEGNCFSKLFKIGSSRARLFLDYSYTLGINRYNDEYLKLGGSSYISGLRNDSLTGNERLVVKLETVTFTPLYLYGFRFAFFGFAIIGTVSEPKMNILQSPYYGSIGFGVRLRNEHLVIRTIEIKLAFFPFVPEGSALRYFEISQNVKRFHNDFNSVEPGIIRFY